MTQEVIADMSGQFFIYNESNIRNVDNNDAEEARAR